MSNRSADSRASAITDWVMALDYQSIRQAESFKKVKLPDGRPLRGVAITRSLWLGRNRKWHAVSGEQAREIDVVSVASLFYLPQLKLLFFMAHRRHKRGWSLSTMAR